MDTPPEQPTDMGEAHPLLVESTAGLRESFNRPPLARIFVVILALAALAVIAWSLSSSNNHPLYPILPTFTPNTELDISEAQVVTFAELNEDPASFQGKRLQVSGIYTPLAAPECLNYTGPVVRWGLVADDLQLNAIGFENLLRLVDEGIEMTVTGIWHLYQGPKGCGKEPAEGSAWFLAVDRILEPNPLQGTFDPALTIVAGTPQIPSAPQNTPGGSPTINSPTEEGTVNSLPTTTISTPQDGLPTVEPTPTQLQVTPLVPPGTQGPITETPGFGITPDMTATLSLTSEPTSSVGETETPGFPTSTPSSPGYPSQGTPTPTVPSGGGYP